MKKIVFFISLFFLANICTAQNKNDDRTESPYFTVLSKDTKLENFPLKSTDVNVNISGPIASVNIEQTYINDGNSTIHAEYVFPMSTKAAVYGMTVYYGDKKLVAKINERDKARKIFEKARDEGKRASLLEQDRPNVFRMQVANILPGEKVKVVLDYTEFINPRDKKYGFVYPTVVGPRFVDPSIKRKKTDGFLNTPYVAQGLKYPGKFSMYVNLISAVPIQKIVSKSHQITINKNTENFSTIYLSNEKKIFEGDRDFILEYQLSGEKIESGTITFKGEDENFFLSVIEPPRRLDRENIPGREYMFVVDVSGSMNGFPLDVSKKLLRNLISNLRPTDMFNILLFASSSIVLSEESVEANPENLEKAIDLLDNQRGGGGTMLLPALKTAFNMPNCGRDISRSFVIVTDGYVHVEEEAFNLIGNNLNNANVFSFGIGSSVNRNLIEGLAQVGRGESFIITDKKFADETAEKFRKYIEYPVLTGIDIAFEGIDAYDIIPKSIPDLFAEKPLYVFGKYRGKANGKLVVNGFTGTEDFSQSVSISDKDNRHKSALKYLWAREKIKGLVALNYVSKTKERIDEITKLGLKYNLMTEYTSFVAVDEEVVANSDKKAKTVKQPLPMPLHVPNTAIGFEMDLGEEVVRAEKPKKKEALEYSLSLSKEDRNLIRKEVSDLLSARGILSKTNEALDIRIEVNEHGVITSVRTKNTELLESLRRILLGKSISVAKVDPYYISLNIKINQ